MSTKEADYKAWLSTPVASGDKYSFSTWLGLETKDRFINLGGGACFATLANFDVKKHVGTEKIWHYKLPTFEGKLAKKAEEIYYPWLLNKSPWAKAFIEKDYEKVKVQGFSLTGHLHSSFLLSALCATRFLTEKYNRADAVQRVTPFMEAIRLGEGVLWSYIFSQLYRPVKVSSQDLVYSPYSAHNTLPNPARARDLKNIVEYNPFFNKETFYTHPGYSGISHIWQHGKDERLTDTLAKTWGVSKVKAEDLNIFRFIDKTSYPVLDTDEAKISALEAMKKDVLSD